MSVWHHISREYTHEVVVGVALFDVTGTDVVLTLLTEATLLDVVKVVFRLLLGTLVVGFIDDVETILLVVAVDGGGAPEATP